jgi:hypothetical protein
MDNCDILRKYLQIIGMPESVYKKFCEDGYKRDGSINRCVELKCKSNYMFYENLRIDFRIFLLNSPKVGSNSNEVKQWADANRCYSEYMELFRSGHFKLNIQELEDMIRNMSGIHCEKFKDDTLRVSKSNRSSHDRKYVPDPNISLQLDDLFSQISTSKHLQVDTRSFGERYDFVSSFFPFDERTFLSSVDYDIVDKYMERAKFKPDDFMSLVKKVYKTFTYENEVVCKNLELIRFHILISIQYLQRLNIEKKTLDLIHAYKFFKNMFDELDFRQVIDIDVFKKLIEISAAYSIGYIDDRIVINVESNPYSKTFLLRDLENKTISILNCIPDIETDLINKVSGKYSNSFEIHVKKRPLPPSEVRFTLPKENINTPYKLVPGGFEPPSDEEKDTGSAAPVSDFNREVDRIRDKSVRHRSSRIKKDLAEHKITFCFNPPRPVAGIMRPSGDKRDQKSEYKSPIQPALTIHQQNKQPIQQQHIHHIQPIQQQHIQPQHIQPIQQQHIQHIQPTQPIQHIQPQHIQPIQPQHIQPIQPQHIQPIQPQHIQPIQPQHIQPIQPQHIQPIQLQHIQPIQLQHIQPLLIPETTQSLAQRPQLVVNTEIVNNSDLILEDISSNVLDDEMNIINSLNLTLPSTEILFSTVVIEAFRKLWPMLLARAYKQYPNKVAITSADILRIFRKAKILYGETDDADYKALASVTNNIASIKRATVTKNKVSKWCHIFTLPLSI